MIDFEKNYYTILELQEGATIEEVKRSYRRLVKKYHPDLHPGNEEYEVKIRQINEAYEVISNEEDKAIYDDYRKRHKEIKEKDSKTDPLKSNKRQYVREKTITQETRIYIKGKLQIKYKGVYIEEGSVNFLSEVFYRMEILEVNAEIQSSDISITDEVEGEFKSVFEKFQPLELDLKLPVKSVIFDGEKSVNYALNIQRVTIPVPRIEKVTKYDNESYGVLSGIFYGYISSFKTTIEEEIVTECFGETGRTETLEEDGHKYYRKEYFSADCTTYWGEWVRIETRETYVPTGVVENKGNYYRNQYFKSDYKDVYWGKWNYNSQYKATNPSGCLGGSLGWLTMLIITVIFIFIFPALIFFLLFPAILFLLTLLPPSILKWILRFFWMALGCLYLLGFVSLFTEINKAKTKSQRHSQNSLVQKRQIRPKQQQIIVKDSMIVNHVKWEDYSENTYEGTYTVKSADLRSSAFNKLNIPIEATNQQNYNRIIHTLKEFDQNKMGGLYSMFDSIKTEKKLDQKAFAESIVSFVQSIPYTLILPKDCNPSLYQDEFTTKYLTSVDAYCEGNQRFGINSPVEFISNLKGDCDTRTLLLYTMLSHYKYDVILLSSSHYKHSLIGINLPYAGIRFPYKKSNYSLWETTTYKAEAGVIPNKISNLNYWKISLKSKIK